MFISSASNSQRLIDPRLIMFTKRRQKNPINVTKKMSSGKAIRRPGCTQEPIKPRFSSLQWVTYGQLICYDDPRASIQWCPTFAISQISSGVAVDGKVQRVKSPAGSLRNWHLRGTGSGGNRLWATRITNGQNVHAVLRSLPDGALM